MSLELLGGNALRFRNWVSNELEITHARVASHKISAPIRLAVISDLHACYYGPGQTKLVTAIRAFAPDAILYTGDTLDDALPPTHSITLFEALRGFCPSFSVLGNHELRYHAGPIYRSLLRRHNIAVLSGEGRILTGSNGAQINICGVDDPSIGEVLFASQLQGARDSVNPALFSVLLSHRPERVWQYLPYGFDLILSGHAHGGQWRLPCLPNGLYAPHQGIFPRHTNGMYRYGKQRHLVSRGLALESTRVVPRIFNRPELVFLTISPVPIK